MGVSEFAGLCFEPVTSQAAACRSGNGHEVGPVWKSAVSRAVVAKHITIICIFGVGVSRCSGLGLEIKLNRGNRARRYALGARVPRDIGC